MIKNYLDKFDKISCKYYAEFDNHYYLFYKHFLRCKNYCDGHSTDLYVYLRKGRKLNDLLHKVESYNNELLSLNNDAIMYNSYKNIKHIIISLLLLISKEISKNNNDLYRFCIYNYELVSSDELSDLYKLVTFEKESEKNENV